MVGFVGLLGEIFLEYCCHLMVLVSSCSTLEAVGGMGCGVLVRFPQELVTVGHRFDQLPLDILAVGHMGLFVEVVPMGHGRCGEISLGTGHCH